MKRSTKLIVLSIVLAVVTGVGLVVCIAVLPFALQARREAARREQCNENIKKIGAAIEQYKNRPAESPDIPIPNDTKLARDNKGARYKELLSKEAEIPKGVVYKKTGADINRKALEKLSQAFLAADRKDDTD
jgi:hypothetical protein